MAILNTLRDLLMEPRLKGIDYESDHLLTVHRQILFEKKMMREVFHEFYKKCRTLDEGFFQGSGLRVEIGAGVSIMKHFYPDTVITDVRKAAFLDKVIDAQNMDFEKDSVRAIYGINCFHHFPNPDKFFNELKRVLNPGGGCVLIEPYYGFIAERFYKRVFDFETFDKSQNEWTNEKLGLAHNANQALSYIVFKRDRRLFEQRHPQLEIVYTGPLRNYLRYLLSGGLNFRKLVPNFSSVLIKVAERLLSPFESALALHHIIVIRKIQ